MKPHELDLVSNICSELEYVQDKESPGESGSDAYLVVSNIRYKMNNGERVPRILILHPGTKTLYALVLVRVETVKELNSKEISDLEDALEHHNEIVKVIPKYFPDYPNYELEISDILNS